MREGELYLLGAVHGWGVAVGKGDATFCREAINQICLRPDAWRKRFYAAADGLPVSRRGRRLVQVSHAVAARRRHHSASSEVGQAGGHTAHYLPA